MSLTREGVLTPEGVGFEDVCQTCTHKSLLGSCLWWKYTTPDLCKLMKEDIKNTPPTYVEHVPKIIVVCVKSISNYTYGSRAKTLKYYKITFRDDFLVKKEEITKKEYLVWRQQRGS